MVKRTLCILSLCFICVLLLSATDTVWISEVSIFANAFKEPFEIFYMVCYDGKAFGISTHHDFKIDINATWVREFLKTKGKTLKDVAIMMHNHFGRHRFSTWAEGGDLAFLGSLRRMGFKGSFCIYVTSTEAIVCKEALHDDN